MKLIKKKKSVQLKIILLLFIQFSNINFINSNVNSAYIQMNSANYELLNFNSDPKPNDSIISKPQINDNLKKSSIRSKPMPFIEHQESDVKNASNNDLTKDELNSHKLMKRTESFFHNKEITSNNLKSVDSKPKTVWKPSNDKGSNSNDGFFQKTSKQNRNTAWEALGAFVLGFVLFFVSIQLTCWNERRAVKFSNFIDWVRNKDNCIYLGRENPNNEKLQIDKAYIVNGPLYVTREVQVDYLNFNKIEAKIKQNQEAKLLFLKFVMEKYMVISESKTGNARVDENGNEEEQYEIKEDWVRISENETLGTQLFQGDANLAGMYKFKLDRIKHLAEQNTLNPSNDDLNFIETYVQSRINSSARVIIYDGYFYIIRSKESLNKNDFSPSTYEFSDNDRRLTIKYYAVKEGEEIFTLGGRLIKKDDELYNVESFPTPIRHAEWNYYLCCCGESDTFHTVDIVSTGIKSKEDIIKDYEFENKACTFCLRICGFILHFMSYYLILYPIIMLVGMIPFIGAVGTTVLIIFAFLFSLITFLFIIAVAWIFARPLYAFFIFGIIIGLIFLSKISQETVKKNNEKYENENDENRNYKFL